MSSLESHTMVPTETMLGRVTGPWLGMVPDVGPGSWSELLMRSPRAPLLPYSRSGCPSDPPPGLPVWGTRTPVASGHMTASPASSAASSHTTGGHASSTGDGVVHRISVLLYSDDVATRDAVRVAVGRRPARDVEVRSWRECATAAGRDRGRGDAARSTCWSWTARPRRSAGWGCAASSRTRSSSARPCSCSPAVRRTAGSPPGRRPTWRCRTRSTRSRWPARSPTSAGPLGSSAAVGARVH